MALSKEEVVVGGEGEGELEVTASLSEIATFSEYEDKKNMGLHTFFKKLIFYFKKRLCVCEIHT